MRPRRVSCAALMLLVMLSFCACAQTTQEGDIPYSHFKTLLRQGKVKELEIGPSVIKGTLKESNFSEPRTFRTFRVEDPDLVKELESHNIQYSGNTESSWGGGLSRWIFPVMIILFIWILMSRRTGSGGKMMSFGKSKAKLYSHESPKVAFEDVAGVEEAKEELQEVVDFLKYPGRYQALGGKLPKGVLLAGAPGTGKTLLARAVAGEAGVPFLSITGSDFVEMYVGVGASRVRDLFKQAQEKMPCIIFVDELDALGKARGPGSMGDHQEREQTLNQLLAEMDGFDAKNGLIVMAATNRPEVLDPALLRPGRFDSHIIVDRPDINGREAILKVHTKNVKLGEDVDLRTLAARTPGMVGAELANIVNQAALLAARNHKQVVEMSDFEHATDRVMTGTEKKKWVMSKRERRMVAYHELGHAITAMCLPQADPVHKVSIIPRSMGSLGHTLQLPTEDRYLLTRSELLDRISVLLGGRAAEEIAFGEFSTGAQNDLENASALARKMVTEYGMSERQGPVTFEGGKRSVFLDTGGGAKEYSEATAREIDDEVKTILRGGYERTKELLTRRRADLDRLAKILIKQEILEGAELKRLLDLGSHGNMDADKREAASLS
jgi:cell division protease FtsH